MSHYIDIVFTGPPGPGAMALIREELRAGGSEDLGLGGLLRMEAVMQKVADGIKKACEFVEVEDEDGRSINAGEWVHRPDGYWVLRIPLPKEQDGNR